MSSGDPIVVVDDTAWIRQRALHLLQRPPEGRRNMSQFAEQLLGSSNAPIMPPLASHHHSILLPAGRQTYPPRSNELGIFEPLGYEDQPNTIEIWSSSLGFQCGSHGPSDLLCSQILSQRLWQGIHKSAYRRYCQMSLANKQCAIDSCSFSRSFHDDFKNKSLEQN